MDVFVTSFSGLYSKLKIKHQQFLSLFILLLYLSIFILIMVKVVFDPLNSYSEIAWLLSEQSV